MSVSPVLKYPGAKWRLAPWIVSQMPTHKVYLEPFFGSGAVLFNKPAVGIETINDLDGNVVNFFKVLREHPDEMANVLYFTPWARDEYLQSYNPSQDELEKARKFAVRCWQAFATRTGYKTGWRHSAQGQAPNMPEQWSKLPNKILELAERLKHVQIENVPALGLIKKYDAANVLIYLDPPYKTSTRSPGIYACEMTDKDHAELLDTLLTHNGKIMLSGYDSEMYRDILKGWRVVSKTASAENGQSKMEMLWMNFESGVFA